MIIKLAWHETLIALVVGGLRRVCSLYKGQRERFDPAIGSGPWQRAIEGAAGEMAFAKYFNVYWDFSINTFGKPDVAGIQVRTTEHRNGCLRVQSHDPSAEPYALLRGSCPEFELVGWAYGYEAKLDAWRRGGEDGKPYYLMPAEHLHDIASLQDLLDERLSHERRRRSA